MNTISKYLILVFASCLIAVGGYFGYRHYILKQAQKNVGELNINVTIYEDVDKGLSDIISLHLSKMHYLGDLILEEIEDDNTVEYCVFNSKFCTEFTSNIDSLAFMSPHSINKKKKGSLFLSNSIPNYEEKIAMNDTILEKVKYKRFAISSKTEYSVFYLQDNLNIPYSFNKQAEKEFNGTITRIDTYNINEDKFISVILQSNNKIQKSFYENLSNNYFKYKKHENI